MKLLLWICVFVQGTLAWNTDEVCIPDVEGYVEPFATDNLAVIGFVKLIDKGRLHGKVTVTINQYSKFEASIDPENGFYEVWFPRLVENSGSDLIGMYKVQIDLPQYNYSEHFGAVKDLSTQMLWQHDILVDGSYDSKMEAVQWRSKLWSDFWFVWSIGTIGLTLYLIGRFVICEVDGNGYREIPKEENVISPISSDDEWRGSDSEDSIHEELDHEYAANHVKPKRNVCSKWVFHCISLAVIGSGLFVYSLSRSLPLQYRLPSDMPTLVDGIRIMGYVQPSVQHAISYTNHQHFPFTVQLDLDGGYWKSIACDYTGYYQLDIPRMATNKPGKLSIVSYPNSGIDIHINPESGPSMYQFNLSSNHTASGSSLPDSYPDISLFGTLHHVFSSNFWLPAFFLSLLLNILFKGYQAKPTSRTPNVGFSASRHQTE